MSRYRLSSVYVVVSIIFIVDRVIGPSLIEDSTKTIVHPAKDNGKEQVLNLDTNPSLGDSMNLDRQRGTESSIPNTTFPTPFSDGEDARLNDATDDSKGHDKTDDTRLQNKTEYSRPHGTIDRPLNTTDETRRHSTTNDSRRHSTTNDSRRHSTTNDSRRHSTTNDSRRHNTTNDSRRHSTTNDSRRHSTTNDSRRHSTTGNSRRHNTTDGPRLHDTTVHTRLRNTKVDMNGVDAAPAFPNHTLSQRTDSANVSSLVRNVSLINESQMENQGDPEQLPFDMERMSNASIFWNRTYYKGKNRSHICSMVKNATFILMLGRKMPLYIDIISLVIGAIGIIGNLATITLVAVSQKLRKPYFLTILTLAVADLLSMILTIGTMFLELELAMYVQCIKPTFYILISSCLSIQINSLLQVVLIAVMKYLFLVYPIKSRIYITNNLIVGLFFMILSYSTCFSFCACYIIMQKVVANDDTFTSSMVIVILTKFLSVLVIILLHFIKVAKLRKSRALNKETRKNMSKVVSIILFIYIAYNFHKVSNQIIFRFTENIELLHILHKSLTIAGFIHHGCNPLIYAAFTPLVQRPWQRLKEKFGKR